MQSNEQQEEEQGSPVAGILNGMLGIMIIFAGGVAFGRSQALGPLPVQKIAVPVVEYRGVVKSDKPETEMQTLVRETAQKYDFPHAWAEALIDQENATWNPKAVNKNLHITAGMPKEKAPEYYDYGVMQVNGRTARGYGVETLTDLLKPKIGVEIGMRHAKSCKRTAEALNRREGVVRRLTFSCFHVGQGRLTQKRGLEYAAKAETHYKRRIG